MVLSRRSRFVRSSSSAFAAVAWPFLSRNMGGFSYSPSLGAASISPAIACVSAATSAAVAFFVGGSETAPVCTEPRPLRVTGATPAIASASSMDMGSTSPVCTSAGFLPKAPRFSAASLTVGSPLPRPFLPKVGSSSIGMSMALRFAVFARAFSSSSDSSRAFALLSGSGFSSCSGSYLAGSRLPSHSMMLRMLIFNAARMK